MAALWSAPDLESESYTPYLMFLIFRKIISWVCLLWYQKQLGHIIFFNHFLHIVYWLACLSLPLALPLFIGKVALLFAHLCWSDLWCTSRSNLAFPCLHMLKDCFGLLSLILFLARSGDWSDEKPNLVLSSQTGTVLNSSLSAAGAGQGREQLASVLKLDLTTKFASTEGRRQESAEEFCTF